MSDEPAALIEIPTPRPKGMSSHYCEHPGFRLWGGWGYPRGRQTVWFCYAHREDGER